MISAADSLAFAISLPLRLFLDFYTVRKKTQLVIAVLLRSGISIGGGTYNASLLLEVGLTGLVALVTTSHVLGCEVADDTRKVGR